MPYARRADLYDVEYGEKDYAGEAATVTRIVRERNPQARTLLDVGCGTGKHLEHFRAELACEGVDLDHDLLAIARERLPGIPLHEADMRDFDLGRRFDAVTCLFSAIGFVGGPDGLAAAARSLARHLEPGGVLVVEPWIRPDEWKPGRPHLQTGDNLARMTLSGLREDRISTTEMHYLVGSPEGIDYWVEHHELYLFTDDEMRAALAGAGLRVEHDPVGLIGRGLWIGTR